MSVEGLFNDSLPEGGTQLKHSNTSHLIHFLLGAAATEVSAHIDKDFLWGEGWFKVDLEQSPNQIRLT